MIWWLGALGVFLLIAAAMYLPDWIRWARWNAKRKRLPDSRAKKLRPPVAPPFWSAYAGPGYLSGSGGSADCTPGGFEGGGASAGAGAGGDGGGGCD